MKFIGGTHEFSLSLFLQQWREDNSPLPVLPSLLNCPFFNSYEVAIGWLGATCFGAFWMTARWFHYISFSFSFSDTPSIYLKSLNQKSFKLNSYDFFHFFTYTFYFLHVSNCYALYRKISQTSLSLFNLFLYSYIWLKFYRLKLEAIFILFLYIWLNTCNLKLVTIFILFTLVLNVIMSF